MEAELWSSDHWRNIEPSAAPLRWALAIESEFHDKVFKPHRKHIQSALGAHAPRSGRACGIGQIAEVSEKAGSNNIGLKIMFAKIRGGDSLASSDTLAKLRIVCDHRNKIAHIREKEGRAYTVEQCHDFLREIRNMGWVFEFLEAL